MGEMKMKPEPDLREIAVATIRDTWRSYPSESLTPGKLARILKEADAGDIYRQMELFEELEEKDCHIFSCLQTRKLAVANRAWDILPAGDRRADRKMADFAKEVIWGIENWQSALTDMLDAIGKGFSVLEIMWEIKNSQVQIGELKWVHQKNFTFDDTLQLRLITEDEPIKGIKLPPAKFVIHTYKAKSGILARGGVVRIVSWMYIFKHFDIKDWITFAEIFGMPLRVGKYPPGASKEDKKILMQAITQLGTDAAGIIPDTMIIDFIEAVKGTSVNVYETLAGFCNVEISKAILGQTLTVEVGNVGSYAASKTHENVREDLVEADAKALQNTIDKQLIKPLIDFNFGPQKVYPHFKIHYEPPEDLKSLAERDAILARIGVKIPVRYFYKKYDLPEPEEGEEVLEPVVAMKDLAEEAIALKKKLTFLKKSTG